MPGAQIFASCTAGNGARADSLLSFKSKVSHNKIGVKSGKLVSYAAHVINTDKKIAVAGLTMTIELPAGVTVVQSKASGSFAMKSMQGNSATAARYRRHVPMEGLLNMTTTPATVTWDDLLFPPRKGIKFGLKVRVDSDVQAPSQLTFRASLYQRLPVNGLPYCKSTSVSQTVVVK